MSPTAFELEAVSILQKGSEKRKGGGGRRVVDGSAADDLGKAYPLARDNMNGAPAKMNLERVNVLNFISLRNCMDTERLGVLLVKGCDFRINTKVLIRLMEYGAFN